MASCKVSSDCLEFVALLDRETSSAFLLDLHGHDVADLYLAMFFKLLSRASHTLNLKECNIGEEHINLMIVALVPCWKLTEFRFLGNPFSFHALKFFFKAFLDFPHLKYVEFPVPRDCYSDDVTYPSVCILIYYCTNEANGRALNSVSKARAAYFSPRKNPKLTTE
uniref:Uncharacterized protein n=1 Tax=Erpetoichthys calabaricus TaxID=27687 RepID=A0A8C4THR7_ERPCA